MRTYKENQMLHRSKKLDNDQEQEVTKLRMALENKEQRSVTFAEAKHMYFEVEEEARKAVIRQYGEISGTNFPKETELDPNMSIVPEIEAAEKEQPKPKKKCLTIAETKLGVTMVLTKTDCTMLNFDINSVTTKDAIKEIRTKLGLPEKKQK